MSPSTLFLISSLLLSLLHHTTSYSSSGPHIADGNILLPPKMTHPVDYRIQVTGGCFKWSWDHHDLLSVLPEYNSSRHCSTSARLKSIAPYSGRKETAVYATDLNTRTVVRYKVYIDTISRIQIFHSSIRIDLDEFAPLRVRAFDSEDSVFSSLVGLQFMWQLIPETLGLPHSLVHVPLKDSPLTDCGGLFDDLDIHVNLEESGVFSDVCIVKGTGIGHTIVSVRLLESSVQNLVDEITLTVVEAMSIDPPSPVYVIVGSAVRYTLKAIHSNRQRVVSLPSPFYQWSALNSSVAEVDREMGTTHALDLGVTPVVIQDTRVRGHMQISSLHVVLPDNLLLFLTPLFLSSDYIDGIKPISSVSRWYLVAGQQYLIHVKAFSSEPGTQEILLTENDVVELSDNQDEFWDILPSAPTKTNYRVINANSYGLGKLTATLAYNTGRDIRKEALKVVQEVMVCDQVKFVMEGERYIFSRILLPWIPGVYQEVELKARGGCAMSTGDYKWVSFDMEVVSVSVSGIAMAKKPGKATIRAVSIFDPLNYDEMVIEVSSPSSMVILPNFPVETPAGSYLQASVTLRASGGTYFHACDAFRSSIRWKTESDSFMIVNATETIELNSSSYGPPCAWTRIYASESGRTVLHATLNRDNQQSDHNDRGSNDVLKVSSRIAAYSPLIVHQASDGNHFGGYWFDMASIESGNELRNLDYVFLAPGTYLDVMLHGGPERWGNGVEFIENVHVWDEWKPYVKNKIFIHQMSTSYGNNSYRIGCKGMGSFDLYFRRGNLVGEDHHLPAVSEARMVLICTIPSYIVIIADEAYAPPLTLSALRAERLPGGIRAAPITVSNGRKIRVSAVGLSNMGIVFANSSSLVLRWGLSECEGLAVFEDSHVSKAYSSWERFLILQNTSGRCIVRSDGVGFIDSLSHLDIPILLERFTNDLTDAIQLQLVSSLRVSPEFSLLFFSPVARLNISISGGSCFFDALVNDTEILEVTQPMRGHECAQLTLAPKGPGPALVTIHDIGLVPPLSASATVQVAEMDWIKILTGEGERMIRIVEGSFQSLNFLVGVDDGLVFDPSQYIYMGIHVHIEKNIVEVVEKYVCGPNFTLQATRPGVTSIYLSAIKDSGHRVLSQLVMLEVYATPRLHPTDIFLVPGSSYVLTVRGGPKIGSRVQYSSMDDHTAKVHEYSGRLSAISPGNSTVIATIYGDGDIMLCQAYGKVKVGIPSSAVLNVQSEQIAIGRTTPTYPSLSKGNLFSFYLLCNNFKWTVEDKYVLNFQVANKEHGTGQDLNFIRVLQGISSGKTNVTVSFSCHYNLSSSVSKSMSYTASISLWVVPNLPLALGSQATWILPSYYTSSDLLPHSLSDEGIDYSLVHWKRKTEEVRDDDIYIDGTKIVTKDSGNLACIEAKDRSTGRSEVASCVRVAEVAQIRIMTDEFPVHEMAVGDELDLPIKYHDTLGNPFHEAHNITPLIEVETNYPDVVSIEEYNGNNIHLQAKSQGLALVQIAFVSDPRKSVYVVISVGPDQLYRPPNPVTHTRGSNLNFNKNRSSDSTSGQRFSGNISIVFVERPSGKAEGTANVQFESLSFGFELQTTITVLKENTVLVDAPNEIRTSVPFPAKGYALTINLSDANSMMISFDPHLALGLPSRARIQTLELNTKSISYSDTAVRTQ